MSTTILDFCRGCGVLLCEDQIEDGKCLNCGALVIEGKNRISGLFQDEDAEALINAGRAELS